MVWKSIVLLNYSYIYVKDASVLQHVYMRPEVNSNRFEILNGFEKSFLLHGNFTGQPWDLKPI